MSERPDEQVIANKIHLHFYLKLIVMKNLAFAFSMLLFSFAAFSQDVILLKTGEEIQAKVTEILPLDIKYKRFDHQDGPTITLPKKEVFLIKYENGMKEVFGGGENVEKITKEANAPPVKEEEIQKPVEPKKKRETPEGDRHFFIGVAYPSSSTLKIGFHGGLESTGYFTRNIGLTSHISAAYNKLSTDYVDGGYISTFFLAGPHFGLRTDNFRIYWLLMAGADWTLATGDLNEGQYYYYNGSGLYFAVGAGFGMVFNDIVEIGLRFNHDVNPSYSSLQFSAGFHF
ncbi:MAG: porin family protein [Lewinellaceae bacterium]|nr:porin family protein [Saprospiraceae bacterium]MCB9339546.1 porin family protein [Lewinellaceae bacterium]